jgi:hypothetical protein
MESFNLLKKVEKVAAPPFLMAQIEAKIQASEVAERLPDGWKTVGSCAFAVLFLGNVFFFKMDDLTIKSPTEQLFESLNLQNQNQIYNE